MDDAFGTMPGPGDETVQRVIRPINEARGWMKLFAVMMFISDGLAAITIVGLLFAWLPIWMGYLLWKAASGAEDAAMSGNEAEAIDSLGHLKTMFTVQGVLTLIYLAFTVIMFIFIIVAVVSSSSN